MTRSSRPSWQTNNCSFFVRILFLVSVNPGLTPAYRELGSAAPAGSFFLAGGELLAQRVGQLASAGPPIGPRNPTVEIRNKFRFPNKEGSKRRGPHDLIIGISDFRFVSDFGFPSRRPQERPSHRWRSLRHRRLGCGPEPAGKWILSGAS